MAADPGLLRHRPYAEAYIEYAHHAEQRLNRYLIATNNYSVSAGAPPSNILVLSCQAIRAASVDCLRTSRPNQ